MALASRHIAPALTLTWAALAACASGDVWRLRPSPILSTGSSVPAVHVSDTMIAGATDTVAVWTRGGGCTRTVPPRITAGDLQVTIRLFDSVLVRWGDDSASACPAVRWDARRTAAIHFSHPGRALVRVIGSDTIDHIVVVR